MNPHQPCETVIIDSVVQMRKQVQRTKNKPAVIGLLIVTYITGSPALAQWPSGRLFRHSTVSHCKSGSPESHFLVNVLSILFWTDPDCGPSYARVEGIPTRFGDGLPLLI